MLYQIFNKKYPFVRPSEVTFILIRQKACIYVIHVNGISRICQCIKYHVKCSVNTPITIKDTTSMLTVSVQVPT